MIYICFLIWALYCIIDGVRDAIFYHHYNLHSKRLFNEHIIFVIQRSMVCFMLFYLSDFNFLLLLSLTLNFSFFHNGSYYTTRHILKKKIYNYDNLYSKKWFAQSTTSTSFWTRYMTPLNRTILFLISVGLLFVI